MPTDTQRAASDTGFPEATVQDYETAGEDVRERLLEHRKAVRGLERSDNAESTQRWVDEFLRTEHALIIAIAKRVREAERTPLLFDAFDRDGRKMGTVEGRASDGAWRTAERLWSSCYYVKRTPEAPHA